MIYTSRASGEMGQAKIESIVQHARLRNTACGVTGMLWFDDSSFAQVLEGERSVVIDAMTRIAADTRHHDIQIVSDRTVTSRLFGEWSMALPGIDSVSMANTAFLVGMGSINGTAEAQRLHDIVLATALEPRFRGVGLA